MITGDEIKQVRRALGKTQEGFGAIFGVGPGAVGHWENGRAAPPKKISDEILALRSEHNLAASIREDRAEYNMGQVGPHGARAIDEYSLKGTADKIYDNLPPHLKAEVDIAYIKAVAVVQLRSKYELKEETECDE